MNIASACLCRRVNMESLIISLLTMTHLQGLLSLHDSMLASGNLDFGRVPTMSGSDKNAS